VAALHRGRHPRGAAHEGPHRAGAHRPGGGPDVPPEARPRLAVRRRVHRAAPPAPAPRARTEHDRGPPRPAGGRPPRRGRRRGAGGGLPVLRGDPGPQLPGRRPRRLVADATRADHPPGPLPRADGPGPARGVPPAHPPGPARRRARLLRPGVTGPSGGPEAPVTLPGPTNRRGKRSVPVHPQVQTILDAMAQMGGPETADLSPPEARQLFKAMSTMEQGEEVLRVDDRHVPTDDG